MCSKTKFVPCSLLQAQYVILKRACVYLCNWGVISEVYSLKSKFVVWSFKRKKMGQKEKSGGVLICIAVGWGFY